MFSLFVYVRLNVAELPFSLLLTRATTLVLSKAALKCSVANLKFPFLKRSFFIYYPCLIYKTEWYRILLFILLTWTTTLVLSIRALRGSVANGRFVKTFAREITHQESLGSRTIWKRTIHTIYKNGPYIYEREWYWWRTAWPIDLQKNVDMLYT